MTFQLLLPDPRYQRPRIPRKKSERPERLVRPPISLNVPGSDFILYGKIGQRGMWKPNPGRSRIKEIETYEFALGLQAHAHTRSRSLALPNVVVILPIFNILIDLVKPTFLCSEPIHIHTPLRPNHSIMLPQGSRAL